MLFFNRFAWQTICTSTGHPALLDLCTTVHGFYKDKAVLQPEQMVALLLLFEFYDKETTALKYEDNWLFRTFLGVCHMAARNKPYEYIQDTDEPDDHPFVAAIPFSDLVPYFGKDDNDLLKLVACTANCILHTASHQLAKEYRPDNHPEVLMKLVRFLDKITYRTDIEISKEEPWKHFVMQPGDVFLIYLAKKRARVLLEEEQPN